MKQPEWRVSSSSSSFCKLFVANCTYAYVYMRMHIYMYMAFICILSF